MACYLSHFFNERLKGEADHPLNKSSDSAIDMDELERNLAAEMKKSAEIEREHEIKTKAIKGRVQTNIISFSTFYFSFNRDA